MSDVDYVAHGGNRCPFCGSNDIEGSETNIDDGVAWQEVGCYACDKSWSDIYKLTGYNPS
jgi:hypothetical protein